MKYTIITLFPQIIQAYIEESIIKKAIQRQLIEIEILDLRKFTKLAHNQVDDYQFGGGAGMILMIEPVVDAIESVRTKKSWVVLTTPQGETWSQKLAKSVVKKHQHLIIVCGHYEGFDERLLKYVDQEISVGDYVLTGGEIASLVILDSTTRILPEVINQESSSQESFENYLLDYPVYTKPVEFRGDKVPEVLLSGHHGKIKEFREYQQLVKTWKNRPDLIKKAKLNKTQLKWLEKIKKGDTSYEFKSN